MYPKDSNKYNSKWRRTINVFKKYLMASTLKTKISHRWRTWLHCQQRVLKEAQLEATIGISMKTGTFRQLLSITCKDLTIQLLNDREPRFTRLYLCDLKTITFRAQFLSRFETTSWQWAGCFLKLVVSTIDMLSMWTDKASELENECLLA
jgi:hypothetical protein